MDLEVKKLKKTQLKWQAKNTVQELSGVDAEVKRNRLSKKIRHRPAFAGLCRIPEAKIQGSPPIFEMCLTKAFIWYLICWATRKHHMNCQVRLKVFKYRCVALLNTGKLAICESKYYTLHTEKALFFTKELPLQGVFDPKT